LVVVKTGMHKSHNSQDKQDDSENDGNAFHRSELITAAAVFARNQVETLLHQFETGMLD
jgi:hypothetical protein